MKQGQFELILCDFYSCHSHSHFTQPLQLKSKSRICVGGVISVLEFTSKSYFQFSFYVVFQKYLPFGDIMAASALYIFFNIFLFLSLRKQSLSKVRMYHKALGNVWFPRCTYLNYEIVKRNKSMGQLQLRRGVQNSDWQRSSIHRIIRQQVTKIFLHNM